MLPLVLRSVHVSTRRTSSGVSKELLVMQTCSKSKVAYKRKSDKKTTIERTQSSKSLAKEYIVYEHVGTQENNGVSKLFSIEQNIT